MSTQTLPAPMVLDNDSPRARLTDRVQSHMAADRSQKTVKPTKLAVLRLILQEGELSGSAINELYQARRDQYGWGKVAFDTPRKRAGELAAEGYLAARYETSDGNHLPEAFYSLRVQGFLALEDARAGVTL